ncbi:Fe/S biogenesis protein NfuA [Buchnera aphidicola (Phyllaphis fagi)]|uniref:NifU family protein n=1 Tax=Buchnera aphidicola TaxID=9 RepID=UPI0034646C5B
MINISKKAQNYLKNILLKKDYVKKLRISIKYPGTKYAECKMSYNTQQDFQNTDIEIKYFHFSIYVNNTILPHLKDSKIDLLYDELHQQLMLMAPYAKEKIDNNQYYNHSLFNKLDHFIQCYINPMLSSHGGQITLLEITNLGYVIIKFLGGCNGCSMVNTTLKENIEKQILNNFPLLKGVKDITKHNYGNHSFI